MVADPQLKTEVKAVPWGKRYRNPLMNAAFWAFWLGFPLAYVGGTQGNSLFINAAFLLFTLACLVPLVTKK
ncbi:MAG: hypothetical protein P4N41_10930 [Negativicutes bacterium]|nr:hypothetical protein [Negativicutes bacterium]